ncbi:hypothetical protein AB0G15_24695 [Streptosporangium sp. NPDC023825]|uniref:hypothetical protein n=1 Tax=Streptosporangium sp. NPDC023825 TaxID=3154909 RepID=UPI00343F70C4
MPRSARSFPVRLGLTLLLVALPMVACGEKHPTAIEAGETLKAHVLKLLEEVNAKNIQITDPGGKDVPCGKDGAKRTFAATGQDIAPERGASGLNELMISASKRVANYKLVSIGDPDDINDPMTVADESSGTSLILQSSINGQYAVRGETECLSRS